MAGNNKFERANVTAIRVCCKCANESTRRLVEDGMSKGLINTHTARGFSVLYHLFARKQCLLCSSLRHKSYLHYLVTSLDSRFILGLGTFAHGFIRRLAASRLRKAARWQLTQGLKPFAKLFLLFWNSLTKKDNYQSNDQWNKHFFARLLLKLLRSFRLIKHVETR